MSAHKVAKDLYRLPPLKDPGDAGTITADRNPCYCPLTSAGAETRTVAVPTQGGINLLLGGRVVAGTITITFTSGMDEDDTTTFAITQAGQFINLESIETAADTFRWRKVADHTTGLTNAALAVASVTYAAAGDINIPANTASSLAIDDGTTDILAIDTRNTIKNTAAVTIIPSPVTIASETAALTSAALSIPARTITFTGTTATTSLLGAALHIGATTFTDASAMTITTVSALHVTAIAAAGGMLTITNSHMIGTSVSGAFLTNAGVWTDMACWESGKEQVSRVAHTVYNAIDRVIATLKPATWKYKAMTELPAMDSQGNTTDENGDPIIHRTPIRDMGRERVGIVYDDLDGSLRCPGEETAVAPGILASFALAAIKRLSDRCDELESRLALKGA